ncbi:MAG: type II toxin-antitoxin system Phd/YefM family antitoxin [Rickettsiaceae bacterium]|nr:type II toxin-antitoxin system Phd/YefM family antitoxin [Rickettsiaceae bacterium]
MTMWQIQEAKAKLSEVVKKAGKEGVQRISVRGKETAVILSIEQYTKLTSPKSTFVDFIQKSPLRDVDIDLSRNKSSCRKIEL